MTGPLPAALAALKASAAVGGVFSDFDGCLAQIVPDPDQAKTIRGASATLSGLAQSFAVVAVVSGRSASDLARRLRVRGVRLIGLHGMEEVRDGVVTVAPEGERARAAIERAATELRAPLRGLRGVSLEHKGLALAVHYRRAPDPPEAEGIVSPLVHGVAAASGLAVVPGRMILEVRPAGAGDKGDAVRRLIRAHGLRAGMVGGDDVGDLPAFAALDGLDVGVRVAVASAESPPELTDRADLVVASPQEYASLLRRLR